jgi:hypothetical protein
MNIYKISQEENYDWDTFDSAIVAADSAEEAKSMNPSGDGNDLRVWTTSDNVEVELIGVAIDGTKKGVICASFNAG